MNERVCVRACVRVRVCVKRTNEALCLAKGGGDKRNYVPVYDQVAMECNNNINYHCTFS